MRVSERTPLRFRAVAATLASLLIWHTPALALDLERDDVRAFVDALVAEHELERDYVIGALAGAERQQSIIDAISRPAEKSKAWHEYRDIFIQPKRVQAGVEFWQEHADAIATISEDTGVPPEILVGIIGVETYYGRITGRYRVIDALTTLGFDYPPRAKFFRRELGEFLVLAREQDVDIESALGSYAGAMGAPQFIPSSYRAYAVDGDGDARVDLWGSWDDVIASVANYFVRHGWRSGAPVTAPATLTNDASISVPTRNKLKTNATVSELQQGGVRFETSLTDDAATRLIAFEGDDGQELHVGFHNFYVITRYNRSAMYAMAVWQLGNEVAEARHASEVATAP